MREIRFRGKRIDTGEWVYGYYLVTAGMPFISVFGKREPIPVTPDTVGQYAGIKDKNGKEIYEGDIVKRTHRYFTTEKQPDATFTVEYINGGFYLTPNYISRNEYEIVVVGNIYDKEGMNKNE